jgi:dTDP-4-amino-4,6-dideoxygalactose transaminase
VRWQRGAEGSATLRSMTAESPPRVGLNDFLRQWASVREDTIAALDRVGQSGWLILGEEVLAFENEFAEWWGIPYAVGVASGLDALEIAMRCADVGPGARVLTTPLTAFATTLAILRVGAEPVWCDVDGTGSLDLDRADAALRADRSIRFLLPVHLYGHPLDPAALERLTHEHDVVLIEDCAQSAGAERGGRPTGTVGVAAGVSLYPTKNLGAMGDGGVLLTGDPAIADRARRLRDYGQSSHYQHSELGLNSRLDELHAAILRSALLPRLDGWLERRRQIASQYVEGLGSLGGTLRPMRPTAGTSANHLFPVEVLSADPSSIRDEMKARGVAVGRHYPVTCADQPAAKGLGAALDSLVTANRLAESELSLPIHPHLTDAEVDRVIEVCLEVCA